ncbi:MAG TPA: CRISPR-associated helicase Cas3' [Desulfotomaculum sp.]|nr:CRISPR-associated helicase Cas3' [Desulfotomaculum sp.]
MYAHSKNHKGQRHTLRDHLYSVSRLAAEFAAKWGAAEIARWMGLWHDLGKIDTGFQAYLHTCEKEQGSRIKGPDHSSAGALFASRFWDGLAFPIAGHHGGLPDYTDLKKRLSEKANHPAVLGSIQSAHELLADPEPGSHDSLIQNLPGQIKEPLRCEFFLRMLFSALVDADYLDTERHFEPEKFECRQPEYTLKSLWKPFQAHQEKLSGHVHDPLNLARHEMYTACLEAAPQPQGIFRLTMPTGGGKTLSGMAFALKHALCHGLDRVIVAIPYTSIIEQTAQVYRRIFGKGAVLEHHSAFGAKETPGFTVESELKLQLAAENWDAPIIVTTTVQLFESLFSHRTSRCRKLHNISRSVIILDEVQTLPAELLEPVLDVIQDLVDHYAVTVVLCTATQPALDDSPYLKGLRHVREIIPNPARYFSALKRVQYELPSDGQRWTWEQVAAKMRDSPRCLAIVNTKRDARALLDALNDPDALHLSTSLCGAHRRWVLAEVHRRLKGGQPCRLVATQVVEAGVDLDFPLVLRAMGPLDRIVQAAGRCNREGRLKDNQGNPVLGRVVIFNPVDGGTPPGSYRSGTREAASLLGAKNADLHDPLLYERYFRRFYQVVAADARNIQTLRRHFQFAEVGNRFRLIPEETVSVIVRPPKELTEEDGAVDELLAHIRFRSGISRELMRRLQPFIVNIYAREVNRLRQAGMLIEVCDGLYQWAGQYDRVYGLTEGNLNPDNLIW